MTEPRPGFLIALEGVDGAGKSTQARLLAEALRRRGLKVVLTREPSDLPSGAKLRAYLGRGGPRLGAAEEFELFMADRRAHVQEIIGPALANGCVVITDRYYYSSAAYQGAMGLDPRRIIAENESFAPRPDLVIVLNLPAAEGLRRRRQVKGEAPQVSEKLTYLKRVARLYRRFQGPGLSRIRAAGSPGKIQARILKLALRALKGWGRREEAAPATPGG